MKRFLVMLVLSTAFPAASHANMVTMSGAGIAEPAPPAPGLSENAAGEAEADFIDDRVADIEWVLQNNPVLMTKVVTDVLRDNPGVVQEIVRRTLMDNPEFVVLALQEFQRRQQSARFEGDRDPSPDFLLRARSGSDAPVRGNPDGTVTLVKFADYNCAHCRAAARILDALIEKNPDLRVVHREWPILGPESVDVARLALASRKQDGYEAFHEALMASSGPVDAPAALEIARSLGMDIARLEQDAQAPDVDEHLRETSKLATEAGFGGTPAWVVGDRTVRGAVGEATLQKIIDEYEVN